MNISSGCDILLPERQNLNTFEVDLRTSFDALVFVPSNRTYAAQVILLLKRSLLYLLDLNADFSVPSAEFASDCCRGHPQGASSPSVAANSSVGDSGCRGTENHVGDSPLRAPVRAPEGGIARNHNRYLKKSLPEVKIGLRPFRNFSR